MSEFIGHMWRRDSKTNKELYGKLSSITTVLQERRVKFIGHMWRRKDEIASQMLLWEAKQGTKKRGRPALTYVDQLRKNTELTTEELKNIMDDCEEWRKLVNDIRASSN